MSTVLTTSSLSIGYRMGKKTRLVLDKIDVHLEKGNLICLLGENGVGKSTLLKTISGVLPAISGEIKIEGIPLNDFNPKTLARKISMVLTGAPRPGMLSAREIIENGRYPHTRWHGGLNQKDQQIIEEAVSLTNIGSLIDEPVSILSDGQLQKVMIARALAQDGDIIVLDEPTAFLDITNRLEIMQLLKSLAKETDKAILVSTHDLEAAFHNADQLWLASCCLPIVEGAPEDLILRGEIGNLFDNDQFMFDATIGSFKQNHAGSKKINLKGEGTYYHWTKRALERINYQVVSQKGLPTLEIISGAGSTQWMFKANGQSQSFESIYDIVSFLKGSH